MANIIEMKKRDPEENQHQGEDYTMPAWFIINIIRNAVVKPLEQLPEDFREGVLAKLGDMGCDDVVIRTIGGETALLINEIMRLDGLK